MTYVTRIAVIMFCVIMGGVFIYYFNNNISNSNTKVSFSSKKQKPLTNEIAAVGDIACPSNYIITKNECHQSFVANAINKTNPKLVIILGDNQYPKGSFFDYKNSYDQRWGKFNKIIKPAVGNHEYYTANANGYYDYFGKAAGKNRKGYYSYNYNSWHLISLNSNCGIVGCDKKSEQYKWLREDLANNKNKCILAYWHHPLFSSGPHGSNKEVRNFWEILEKNNTEIILNGHDHHYERFGSMTSKGELSKQGIREFIVGTGGKSHYPINKIQKHSYFINSTDYGFLNLSLKENKYAWQFITEKNKIIDHGKRKCH